MNHDVCDEANSILESHSYDVLENCHPGHVDSLRKVCPHLRNRTIGRSHQQAQILTLPLQQSSGITVLLLLLNKRLRHDLQDASMMRKMQAILQGWYQLLLHKREAEAVLLGHCLEAWAAMARRAGLLRFLLIEHAAIRQVRLMVVTAHCVGFSVVSQICKAC